MNSPYLRIVQGDFQNIAFGDYGNTADLTGAIVAFAAYAPQFVGGSDCLWFETSSNGGLMNLTGNNVSANLPSAYTNNINTTAKAKWYLRAQLATGQLKLLDQGLLTVAAGLPTDLNIAPYVPGQAAAAITPQPNITGLIGGTTDKLDGVDDTSLATGTTYLLSYGQVPQFFQIFDNITSNTNVSATPAVVRVKTYSPTNQRAWIQLT